MSDLKNVVSEIKNPITNLSLGDENRIISVEPKGDDIYIKYNRDGITPDVKKTIENLIIDSLKDSFSEDNIYVLTESKSSQDIYKSTKSHNPNASKNPAQLKVGHGKVEEKKKIPGVKHVISIGSGKGGVGKSTVTANLAATLTSMGYKVGIIDADIYGPSMPMLFNRRNDKPEATEDKKIIPLENHGIKFISFGNFIHEDEPVVWRGPMLGGVLNQFFFETDWGELDFLLLDLPPGTGDVQLSMVQSIELDGSIIVSTPQDIALLDARKALHMFDKLGVHVIGMVENMSSFICDNCDKEHFIYGTNGVLAATNELGVGFLGSIPLELGLRKGSDFGTPYMSQNKYEGSKVYNSYREIASKISDYFFPNPEKKKGLLSKLFKN
ncbi:MAG: Mrp/NBP35 family ATP-binding protein [Bacteriovoracaceae bacterium]|jgi:ATP-binding protein involved in chromosome partitioning|nr:Mrp/NBP35 family ATP-binding protein [Bacteriovoracaceae bacterium]